MNKLRALIIIDVQNDFLSPYGYLANQGRDVTKMHHIIEPINKLILRFKQNHEPVICIKSHYDSKYQTERTAKFIPVRLCNENTVGSKFYGIDQNDADITLIKHTYDAFSNVGLKKYLDDNKIQELVFCGVFTNVCVEFSARTAFTHGYSVIIPSDCVSTYWDNFHENSLNSMGKYFATVTTSDLLLGK